jgi:hypothetical protein
MRVVIHSDHGHIIGNAQTGASTRIQGLVTAVIVTRHHANGLWQLFKPTCDLLLFLLPRSCPASPTAAEKHRAFLSGSLDLGYEQITSPILVRILTARGATECEILQSALL